MDAKLYPGAYYMCGYVVECALKACICRKTSQFDFHPHPKESQKAWSHNYANLIDASGLEEQFKVARQADSALDVKCKQVDDWTEAAVMPNVAKRRPRNSSPQFPIRITEYSHV